MKQDQVVDIVLENLSALHQMPKEELWCMCPSSMIKHWSVDLLVMGAFSEFTPYLLEDYLQHLFQPEGRIYFAGEHACLPYAWIDTAIKSGLRAARNIQAAVDEEDKEGSQPSLTPRLVSNAERNP